MNNMMEYKGYYALVEFSPEDEVFFGSLQGIDDRVSFEGNSVEELKSSFLHAVENYLDLCERTGKIPQKKYKGSFNVRIDPDLHKRAAIMAQSQHVSLNKLIEIALDRFVASP